MTFNEVLSQSIAMLEQHGRVSYRALKRQFDLDDDYLEDLRYEIVEVQRLAVDQDDIILVWIGSDKEAPPISTFQPAAASVPPPSRQDQPIQSEASPSPEPPIPDAERRQLTVMFCDLADSTKLSGQLDPEDLRDVIRAYQSTSAEVIERYDGYIAQHLGDGLMVYFGWPQAHEDDAQRAVYAGFGILKAMQGLNTRLGQEKGIRLAIRIGIHTGLVVVGEIGHGVSQEHLALGETPNIASRIEGLAESDTIAISDATYQLIQGYFVFADLGHHTLKGVDEPQRVYRVMSVSGAQSRLDVGVAMGLTPLVGREQEVGLLFERWQQVREGQGQVFLLSGEAGIGKSRLVQVLKDHIADEPYNLQECRCSPYHTNSAFYPLADLLQRKLDWQSEDTNADKLHKLETVLTQTHLDLQQAVPLFANLLSLPVSETQYPSLNLTPQRQRQKTLETIVAIVLEQAEEQPVLFVLEDLHWVDPSSLELLSLLIEHVPTTCMLILLTFRPGFAPPWTMAAHLSHLTLNRFAPQQIERIATQVAGGKALPADIIQHIVSRTDGVPLFVEELTKTVLESGLLEAHDDRYVHSGPLPALAIPATLQDSLMARLDRLGSAKGIAQIGATIGRQFSYELLHAVSQMDVATVQRELDKLVEAELFYQRGLPPQATYQFKHALIQDTAYQSLLRRRRRQVHAQIARVLEGQFPETVEGQPELLAHHYTEAGLVAQAVRYWKQAGETAIERSAHVEAINHLRKGLTELQGLSDTAERDRYELSMQTNLGSALALTRGYAAPESGQAYIRARDLCQHLGDTTQLAAVLVGLRRFHMLRGELPLARQMAEELLDAVQHQHDPVRRMEAHAALGIALTFLGEFPLARQQLEQGLNIYNLQQHGADALRQYQSPVIDCLSYTGRVLWQLGYPDQALQRCQESYTLAQAFEHPYSLMYALTHTALVHQYRHETQACQARAEAALALATEHGFTQWVANANVLLGWGLAMQGQVWQGIELIQQGTAAFLATGAGLSQTYHLTMLVNAYQQAGQITAGLTALAEAFTVAQKTSAHYLVANLHRLKGELLLQLSIDNQSEAESCFHQALSIARRQQAKSWELRATTSLARLWQSQGKRQEAYELLAPVYGWFTEGFDTADLKDAKSLLDELG